MSLSTHTRLSVHTAAIDRTHRDIALYRAGAVESHGDLFIVSGKVRNYTVTLADDGEPCCTCLDLAKRREICTHGYAVVNCASQKACRRRKSAAMPKTGLRHTDGIRGVLVDLDRMSLARNVWASSFYNAPGH